MVIYKYYFLSGLIILTKFLIKYISGKYDVSSALGREKVGTMSGICGILCNALLCIMKFVIGTLTGSVSITADAFNTFLTQLRMLLLSQEQSLQINLSIKNTPLVTAGLNIFPLLSFHLLFF